jgi:hypothetical protein
VTWDDDERRRAAAVLAEAQSSDWPDGDEHWSERTQRIVAEMRELLAAAVAHPLEDPLRRAWDNPIDARYDEGDEA